MDAKELCFELAAADGTSGDEAAACAVCEKYLSKFMTVKTDITGSLVGTLGNGKFKAHKQREKRGGVNEENIQKNIQNGLPVEQFANFHDTHSLRFCIENLEMLYCMLFAPSSRS